MKKRLAVAVLALLFAIAAHAADFTTQSFRVGINVDGSYVPSSMYVRMKVRHYDVPLDTFAVGQLDPQEATFAALMNAIREKNYIRAEGLLRTTVVAAQVEQARSRVTQQPRTLRQTVDLYDNAFNGLRDVTVVADVLAGSRSLFIWDASTPKGAIRRAFAIGLSGQKLTASEVTMANPIEVFILDNVMTPLGKNAAAFKPQAAVKKRYEYALPIDGPGNPGPNHVTLQFDGEPLDFDVFDDGVAPANDVDTLYRTAYHALKIRANDDFLEHFTPASRETMRKWFTSMGPATMDAYHAAMTGGRKLHFVIDADPVFIVFYTIPGQQMPPGTMAYDYVVRERDGKLAFANVAREGFLDDVLKNPALFDVNDAFNNGPKQR